ncbi:hypothetical protein [Tichowtungia aerotolerans]|uniref:Uncharacterized protein n=1 Tax=Tichowtungia aerotolerans TaxID=2697043 RepID=A0A6P1M4T0_9BACT|nr:hypothetical protein [Tichowtungia aerotolerans]QHI68847.1 hypothetical protein GT409_05075 [Tichowtungia aerotolerans]
MSCIFKNRFGWTAGLLMYAVVTGFAEDRPGRCFREIGGSNYVMYDVADEYLKGGQGWFRPGVLRPVVGTFHLQEKEDISAQLKAMADSGQRKISIMMWHDHLTPEQLAAGGVFGHVLASNGGVLLPQHEQNLKELLALVQESGFNELIFRFAQQGSAWSQEWKDWDEELYQENLNFIVFVRALVREALDGSGMRLRFDLGAELGGIESGRVTEYTKKLWAEYARRFGTEDTFGFSIAAHPGRVARWIDVCDEVGVRPECYALDLYNHIPQWMPRMISEFYEAEIRSPKIIVLETYWNDLQVLEELQQVADQFNLQYEFLMQWPWRRGSAHPHFSDVFDRPEYDVYLGSGPDGK